MPQTRPPRRWRDLLGSDERLIFIRGGWSEYYDMERKEEPPRGGGSYNDHAVGWEANNFHPHDGEYYVYTRSGASKPLNLQRLGAEPGAEEIDGVMVVQVATRPEGKQVVVGWFRGATAFADWQERPFARDEGCAFIAPVDQAVLLPPDERDIVVRKGVPGAMGQSQVRYASDTSGRLQLDDWMIDVLEEIRQRESRGSLASPVRATPTIETSGASGQGRGLTTRQQKAVEDFAMARAIEHFKGLYDTVKDDHIRHPYDLLCSNRGGGPELRVEVKGTTGDASKIIVTRGEVVSARSHLTALFIASELTWADKDAAELHPRKWHKTVIEPWVPADGDLVPTAYEWHNSAFKKGTP